MNNFKFLKYNFSILKKETEQDLLLKYSEQTRFGYNVFTENIEHYINEELLNLLLDNNLKPKLIVLFKGKAKSRSKEKALLHSDIYYDFIYKKYKFHYCGLNQELYNTKAIFHWWEPIDAKPVYPSKVNLMYKELTFLDGLHYEARSKYFNNPEEKFKLLESTNYDNRKIILARTDIPHSVIYESNTNLEKNPRASVSLRFDTSLFNSWNDVINRFERLL